MRKTLLISLTLVLTATTASARQPGFERTWGGMNEEIAEGVAVAASTSPAPPMGLATPYVFDRTKQTTKRPDGFPGVPAAAVADAGGVVGDAAGIVLTPPGSETFAGTTDALLLKVVPPR